MCYDAKSSMMAFLLMIIIAAFLFYRNEDYDWVIAAVAIPVALIQLIEWGLHTNALDGAQGGALIYFTLWLQVVVFALATWSVVTTGLSGLWLILIVVLFIYLVYNLERNLFTVEVSACSTSEGSMGNLLWKKNGEDIMNPLGFVYLLGVTLPFLFLLSYYGWSNVGLWLLLGYIILSALLVFWIFGGTKFPSMWCYVAVGFFFLAWLIGIFKTPITCT